MTLVQGVLRGAAWDPRVAWVDDNAIGWPAGWSARFTPGPELVTPTGEVYRPGDVLRVSGLAVARASEPAPLPSAP